VFPLGHVGIGTHLVPRRLRERLPWRWLALGCLLPDVIDKPIWMVARLFNAPWAHVETARLLGHTAFVALAFAMAAWLLRRPKIVALAYGIPTHLFLDGLADAGMGFGLGVWKSWLFWKQV
jgi:hypothetical protein